MSARRFVLFDYGNTLVPYGRREAAEVEAAVAAVAGGFFPGVDPLAFRARVRGVKDRLIRRTRETGDEIRGEELAAALAAEAGIAIPPAGFREAVEREQAAAFERVLSLPPGVPQVLDLLRERWTLGLVSNYSFASPILRTLDMFRLRERLAVVVVSADVGRVKPGPEPFRAALDALGARPAECVFVGDNLHADIGGAGALGMATVHTREWLEDALPHDTWEGPDGIVPDAVIDRLADLPDLLSNRWPR